MTANGFESKYALNYSNKSYLASDVLAETEPESTWVTLPKTTPPLVVGAPIFHDEVGWRTWSCCPAAAPGAASGAECTSWQLNLSFHKMGTIDPGAMCLTPS